MKSAVTIALLLSRGTLGAVLPDLIPRQDDNGAPIDPSWRDVKCDFGSLPDARSDPFKLWNDAKASQAWNELYIEWDKSPKNIPFSNFAANFFHARPDPECGSIDNANCEVTINCGQADTPNAPVNSPAGYMIFNSMVSLHQHFEAQYHGLQNALNFMNGEVGTWTSIFAPQVSQLSDNYILVDVIGIVFGVVSAGAFHKWMSQMPYFKGKPNNLNFLADSNAAASAWGLSIIKDSMSSIDQLAVQNDMANFLSKTVELWIEATKRALHYAIEEAPLAMFNQIVNGKMWDLGAKKDALDLTKEVRLALYTYMTPVAWKKATVEVGAFIATSEGMTGTNGDCDSFDIEGLFRKYDFPYDKDLLRELRLCSNGENNPYWFVNIKRSTKRKNDCNVPGTGGVSFCAQPHIVKVPGWDDLDGSQFGGLHRHNISSSAFIAWQMNGRKNGWKGADWTTPEGQKEFLERGIQAPGMANIPICSFQEAFHNAWPEIHTDNWPCN